jgi:hypothetical protein
MASKSSRAIGWLLKEKEADVQMQNDSRLKKRQQELNNHLSNRYNTKVIVLSCAQSEKKNIILNNQPKGPHGALAMQE